MKKIKNLLMVVFGLKPKSNGSRDVYNERRLYLSSYIHRRCLDFGKQKQIKEGHKWN